MSSLISYPVDGVIGWEPAFIIIIDYLRWRDFLQNTWCAWCCRGNNHIDIEVAKDNDRIKWRYGEF